MGSSLTVQKLKQNLSNYELDLNQYIIQAQNPHTNNKDNIIVWKHITKSQRIIEKKYFIKTEIQYYQILQAFAFRHNNQFVMASKYIIVENLKHNQELPNSIGYSQRCIRIFFQPSITTLAYFNEIPQQDAGYFLLQMLKGFKKLSEKIDFSFQVNEQMFHITEQKKAKVWLNENPYQIRNFGDTNFRKLSDQRRFVDQILRIVQKNIYFTINEENNQAVNEFLMLPIVLEQIIRESPQSLEQAIQLVDFYLRDSDCKVGTQMTCLNQLSNEQLINIMQLTRIRIIQNSPSHSHFPNSQHHVVNTTQILNNNFILNSQPYSQNPFKNNHLPFQSIITCKSKQKIYRSNSCSNKRSGISLVKKQNSRSNITAYNNPVSDANNQSWIVIRPQSAIKYTTNNYQNKVHNNQMPLNSNSNGMKLERKNSQEQIYKNKESRNVLIRNSSVSKTNSKSNISKGIQITSTINKVPSLDFVDSLNQNKAHHNYSSQINLKIIKHNQNKTNKLSLTVQNNKTAIPNHAPFRANNHLNSTNQISKPTSWVNNSQIMNNNKNNSFAGKINFPLPIIDSNASNLFHNFPTINNISQTKNCQNSSQNSFYNFSSFEPHLQNQSLTRFHKQFINPNCSASQQQRKSFNNHIVENDHRTVHNQQYYQIPKVYVHSPKAKNKIFRADSGNSDKTDKNRQLQMQRINQDFIIQERQRQQQRIRKSAQQFNKCINDKERVFTDPVLYEYITNTSSQLQMNSKNDGYPSGNRISNVIDHLSNIQISQSLDYHTAEQVFNRMNLKQNHNHQKQLFRNGADYQNYQAQHIYENNQNHFTLNDFPTIQQIQQNPNDQNGSRQNLSFVPVPLNFNGQNYNLLSANNKQTNRNPPSSVRRGYQQSMVVQYKKFYDDTNRSNNSPNKHYFSPLKKQHTLQNNKYATANNWQVAPSMPLAIDRKNIIQYQVNHAQINSYNNFLKQNGRQNRQNQASPTTKIIFKGQKPSINPLLLQDMQKVRHTRLH